MGVGAKRWWKDQRTFGRKVYANSVLESKYSLPLLVPEVKASKVNLMVAIHVSAIQNKLLWYKSYTSEYVFLNYK